MKKKLILGLFVCVLSLSLSLSLNISVKANASTSELSISPILVPVEKVDLVQNLISDIEFDLSEKDTNVILELSTFKAKCQELLFTNDNENLEILINEIDEIILEYSEYKLNEQSRGVYHLTYSPAIAAIASGFIVAGWELSAELLLHARDNNELYSEYNPVFATNVGYSQAFQDLVEDDTISGNYAFYSPNFLNFTKYDEDAYFAIHGFSYQKMYYNESKINIVIHDIYDYAMDTGGGLQATLNNLCYEAQIAGVLVPYFVVIDLISDGKIPFKYSINGNNISIDKYLSDDLDFVIPEEIDNHNLLYEDGEPVQKYIIKTISQNAFQNSNINSIVIPNTVTNIDSYAFEGCTNLESVKLSNSLYAIGVGAFKGCTNLEEIEIPASVQHIDSNAFENCSTLREVTVKKSKEAITHIGENAFDGCSSLLQIIVPKNRLAEYKNKVYWSSYKSKIIPDSAVFDELDLHCLVDNLNNVTLSAGYNKLYKLNVECNKSYKFTTSPGIELKVYDEYFDELYTGENTLYAYLSPGTYYLDVRYNSSATSGTITIDYELRWTHDGERVYYNDDHNLLTHLHETSDGTYLNKLYYINNNGAGLYKFQLNGSYSNNSPIVYDAGTLTIYNESGRLETQLLNRYPNSSIMASSDDNQDVMYVYLPRNGYFYINIVMPSESYGTLSLTISPVESETIDLLSSMTSTFTEDLAVDNNLEEYAKKLIINQTSKYLITLSSINALSNNFDIIMFKQTYSSSSNAYYTNFKSINYITNTSTQKAFEVSLDVGVYFIYYYGNDTNVNIDLTLTRVLQNNNDRAYAMQADPAGSGYNPGSEVRFNNGSRNNYTITEGFTRNMFFVLEDFYTYSRLDFDWYSSNVNVATVSKFGTVFANNVSSTQTVTIYAVYKEDPSLIYYRTFNVVDDISDEQIVITCNMSYSYSEENGDYQIELTDDNSPYPMIQYYDWSVYVPCQETDITCSINTWGEITASGPGYATLTGTYTINPRVTIIINLTITE